MTGGHILSLSDAPGWWAVRRLEDTEPVRQRRHPVAAWAVVSTSRSPIDAERVVGLVSAGAHLAEAPRGAWFAHDSDFPTCTCSAPLVEAADLRWCERCAGTLAEAVR